MNRKALIAPVVTVVVSAAIALLGYISTGGTDALILETVRPPEAAWGRDDAADVALPIAGEKSLVAAGLLGPAWQDGVVAGLAPEGDLGDGTAGEGGAAATDGSGQATATDDTTATDAPASTSRTTSAPPATSRPTSRATTKPPVATTKPPVATTKPPVATTKPPVATTKPPTTKASAPPASIVPGPGAGPGPDNTGPKVNPSRTLGATTITANGTVLDGYTINGCVDVEANDVVISNSLIRCDAGQVVENHGVRLTIRDTEIDGLGKASNCIAHDSYTALRVDCHNSIDGMRANGDVEILDSYIHHLSREVADTHNDTIQTTKGSNIVIMGNRLMAYNESTKHPNQSSYILKSDQGSISNVTFARNYSDGGNFTLVIESASGGGISNLTFTDNTFGRDHRYGVIGAVPGDVTWRNNVYADNQQPVR